MQLELQFFEMFPIPLRLYRDKKRSKKASKFVLLYIQICVKRACKGKACIFRCSHIAKFAFTGKKVVWRYIYPYMYMYKSRYLNLYK